ncbi:hypothetical protein TEA_019511 [Camellia sinensis var. sinensis]|uniref:Alpha 1,4-glycosyltransferase domain-containing protein n=1 Tax=Camellia sinensis var. sinensis TaxID=542762 RepID=A0A4S4F3S2_CAMSN|nr:hypothetical protein TEA_019511 [Camellia sinensis var. sinensis]
MDNNTNPSSHPHHHHHSLSLRRLQRTSLLALLSLLLLLLLVYNGAAIFCLQLPFPAKTPPETASFTPEKVAGETKKWHSSPTKLSSTVLFSLKEENTPSIPKTHFHFLKKSQNSVLPTNNSIIFARKRRRKHRTQFGILRSEARKDGFSKRVKEFFNSSSCEVRFFMTWISSIDSFGERELFSIESVFKSHPNGCLIIVSNSMDSTRGTRILRPFLDKGFHLISISPDFDYLFKNTLAETWFDQLKKGNVDPGEVSLGQNLSNLIRLALLYKFGGVYIDTDVIILKSFAKLRNVIGAQTIDLETGNWTRLNNAILVFDKSHPLLYKFIQEFALTFDGNKWGHNGPYLVSRVVSRVKERPGFDFDVLNPVAFYPVDWSRIRGLFRGPRNETHSKWLHHKLNHIRSHSYAVHLWNKQSRKLKIKEGSIISRIMLDCCVFCNSSATASKVSFAKLRNVIGAQTIDLETGNWTRLNNAILVFDKSHPLLYKFIQEFALTFDGNKWGHNGPYLVSRVVSRVKERPGFDFDVLNPVAFYPVDWSRIRGLFRGPRNETHSKWLHHKLNHIRSHSYAVHLWNKQSRKLKIKEGSIISRIMLDCCVFCNSSATASKVVSTR